MPSRPSVVLPSALCAALLAGLGVQLALPTPQRAAPTATVRSNAAGRSRPGVHSATPVALAAYPAILARPLFTPDRSPAGTTGAAVAGQGQLSLAGVGYGPSGGSATLRTVDGAVQTVALGQDARGWRLVAVSIDSAVLERNGVRQLLRLGAPPATVPVAGESAPVPPPPIPGPSRPPHFSVHGSR